MSEIVRNPPKRQQNSVNPNKVQTAYELNRNPTPGLISLNEAIKLTTQKAFTREVDNGIVIDLVSPRNSLKTKYNLPHLNFKQDKNGNIITVEGFLLKVRSPDVDKDVLTTTPEDILLEAMNLDKGSSAAFRKVTKSNPQSVEAWKKYCSYSSLHGTFAPASKDGFFSLPPLPGSRVRLRYFQEPHISAGHTIVGVYEKLYEDKMFEEGFSEISNFLEKFRQKYIQTAMQSITQLTTSNLPIINSILASAGISSNNSATLTLNNTPGQQITTISAADYKVVSELPAGSVNREIFEAAISYPDGFGGQYSTTGNGVLETIYHKGQVVLQHTGGTYCSGATFTIAMKIINKRNLLANKTLEEVKKFQKIWYGSDPSSMIQQQGPALQAMGIGGPVSQQEALPGDFAQIWRTNNSGHSTIFVGWIVESGKIVGLKYRSSQGSGAGSGLGNGQEYFSDSGKGSVMRDRLYFSRIKQ